jgi:hypothetical protein
MYINHIILKKKEIANLLVNIREKKNVIKEE